MTQMSTAGDGKKRITIKSLQKAHKDKGKDAKVTHTGESSSESKKVKRKALAEDELGWKAVKTPHISGMDAGGGMMMLEELDGVNVTWEEDENGRKTAHFVQMEGGETSGKVKGKGKERDTSPTSPDEPQPEDDSKPQKRAKKIKRADGADEGLPDFTNLMEEDLNEVDDDAAKTDASFNDKKLPHWKGLDIHPSLKRALLAMKFQKPTEIQKRSMPFALNGRDIVGVAETGSGKTLAYSLPILSRLLSSPPSTQSPRQLSALILCPTRELALQVVEHISKVVDQAVPKKQGGGPPRISIGSVVGGLSAQKQKRIVERGCDILVATPGRLWDLIQANQDLASGIRTMQFLVIDEADRMIETGHFAELESIIRLTQRSTSDSTEEDDPVFAQMTELAEPSEDLQTFIFSATLSKDLQHNLRKRKRFQPKKGQKKATALEDLVERLDFRDPEPEVIDLTPEGRLVATLKESMIECLATEKDLYLYYFLLRYSGRSLVFVGSIDGIRRLIPLFETLQLPVYPLHSQLQQKQRLKNLDRFKSSSNGTLIATDVAARGLDIPQVDHVVHFNLPRTADAYIHRSGRTARAQNPGFALQLCSPEEKGVQRALMKSLGRGGQEVSELPIDSGFLPSLKERLNIARNIEKAQHKVKKENHDRNWLKEAADDLGVDIDPSLMSDEDDPDLPFHRSKKAKGSGSSKGSSKNVESLKAELRDLLVQPLMARGVSSRYPTSGSKVIIDDLLRSKGHTVMLGAKTTKAHDEELLKRKPIKTNKRKRQ